MMRCFRTRSCAGGGLIPELSLLTDAHFWIEAGGSETQVVVLTKFFHPLSGQSPSLAA